MIALSTLIPCVVRNRTAMPPPKLSPYMASRWSMPRSFNHCAVSSTVFSTEMKSLCSSGSCPSGVTSMT